MLDQRVAVATGNTSAAGSRVHKAYPGTGALELLYLVLWLRSAREAMDDWLHGKGMKQRKIWVGNSGGFRTLALR